MSLRTTLTGVSLALVALSPAVAATDPACQTTAAAIRALSPPVAEPTSDEVESPIERAAAAPHAAVTLSEPQALTADAIAGLDATLTRDFHAPADLLKAVDGLDPAQADEVWLRSAGDLRMIETEAGTADCSSFVFFTASAGRSALAPDAPQVKAAEDEDGSMSFCTTAAGRLGQIGASPVFIDEGWDPTDPAYEISITTWRNGGWTTPCKLSVRYVRRYVVGEFHCDGSACGPLRTAAPQLAEARQAQTLRAVDESPPATFAWGPAITAADRAQFGRIKAALDDAGEQLDLPTLGKAAETQHGFGDDAVTFPLELGGHVYAAVLGHGRIGWRLFPDYLLALYDVKDGKLATIAGTVIALQVAGPVTVK
jgi:hypothetical protein